MIHGARDCYFFFCLMIRLPPRSTLTDTLFPLHDALPICCLLWARIAGVGTASWDGAASWRFPAGAEEVSPAAGRGPGRGTTTPAASGDRSARDRKSTRLNSSH